MIEVIAKIFPLIALVIIGFVLKKAGKLKEETSKSIINIAFEVFLPATVFLAISCADITIGFISIPFFSMAIISGIYLISKFTFLKINIEKQDAKVMVIGAMLMNTAAIGIPVMESLYGNEGAVVASLFDFGCAILIYTLGYFTVSKEKMEIKLLIKKTLGSNVIWALFIGIVFNIFNIELGNTFDNVIETLSYGTIPVMMIGIGGMMQPQIKNGKNTLLSVFFRNIVGFFIGILIVHLFGLEGLVKSMVLIGSILPSAIITIVFAVKEELNCQLAIEIVSISTLLFFIILPFVAQI